MLLIKDGLTITMTKIESRIVLKILKYLLLLFMIFLQLNLPKVFGMPSLRHSNVLRCQ